MTPERQIEAGSCPESGQIAVAVVVDAAPSTTDC